MEPKPKERIVFDEDLYYGDEGEEMAINDLMERDGLTEGEVREDFTDDEIFNHQMEMKDFDYEEEMRALAAFFNGEKSDMEAAYLVVAHGGSDLPVERLSRSQLLTINNILLQGHIPYETVRAIAKPAFTPESMEVIAAAMENARHAPYTGEHSLTEAQVARIMNPEYRPEQQIALLTAMRGQTPVADLSDADFAGLFPASLSVEQMSACAYAVNRCGYNTPLLMMTMQACADMNAQQLMAVFDATAAEFSDATMAKVSTILMHTPALTSQQMRYLLAEARDGTPFPALESMKEHLLAQAEPEKAQVTETGIKSESRDMASGKEALAEQTGLDGTQKINQNKEME